MRFFPPLDQPSLDNRCLTFLAFDDYQSGGDPESSGAIETTPGLTYSLETGRVWARRSLSAERVAVSLRNNPRLASWEPMTTDKLCLTALELNIGSESNEDSSLAAYVVSPEGFVFRWNEDGATLRISDVRRLANTPTALRSGSHGDWSLYRAHEHGVEGPGINDEPADPALVSNGRTPVPDDPGLVITNSLAECGAVAPAICSYEHRTTGEFTPEATAFVAEHFGVNVNAIDWREANKARLISKAYAALAPFDPVAACAALRLAALNSKAQITAAHRAPNALTQREPPPSLTPRGSPGTRPGQ